MEWENKSPSGPTKFRQAGLIFLGVGAVLLAIAIVLIMAGTVLATVLMVCSIMVNTAAVIFLRKKS